MSYRAHEVVDEIIGWSAELNLASHAYRIAIDRDDAARAFIEAEAIETAMDWISDARPETLEGLFALGVASASLARSMHLATDSQRSHQLYRAAYSLVEALETASGLKRADFGGGLMIGEDTDPRGARGARN